jgi:hypothetical protein
METIKPAHEIQNGLAFLLGAVERDEIGQRQAWLKLKAIDGQWSSCLVHVYHY